jgi:hypothetical protein
MNRKSVSLVALLVALSVAVWGCAAAAGAAAGVGTYAWTQGKLTFDTPNTVSASQNATLAAFNDLGIKLTGQETSKLGGKIKGITDTGEEVTVDLEPKGAEVTKIDIRVGFFGDRGKSEKIADTIRKHL